MHQKRIVDVCRAARTGVVLHFVGRCLEVGGGDEGQLWMMVPERDLPTDEAHVIPARAT